MNEDILRERISLLKLPDSAVARERTAALARARLGEPRPRVRAARIRRLVLVTAALALALTAFAFTPPGRAVANWFGDLFGTGDVGGPPTLRLHRGLVPHTTRPIVVATGQTPQGDRFEIVSYKGSGSFAKCLSLDLPESRDSSGTCNNLSLGGQPIVVEGTGLQNGPSSFREIDGILSPEVAEVRFSYPASSGEASETVASAQIAGPLLQRIHERHPFGVFVGFPPPSVRLVQVTATAYDSDGNMLGQAHAFGSGPAPVYVPPRQPAATTTVEVSPNGGSTTTSTSVGR